MRTCSLAAVIGIALALTAPSSRAESIGEVLHRSHQMRLQELSDVAHDSPAAKQLHLQFDRLLELIGLDAPVELRVVRSGTVAETLHGYVVVVHEGLAGRSEGEQLFILAHELGHVAQSHWTRLGRLYEKWVPGVVAQAETDAVAASLGREAVVLAHQNEFQADAFAYRALRALGYAQAQVPMFLIGMGVQYDTATHPSSRKRIAQLRHLADNEVAARPDD